jgi:hypothetical protein
MFRKLLLSTVAVAGLVAPLTLTPVVQANDWHHVIRHEICFDVLYRDPCHPGWVEAGRFRNRHEADRVAASYRCRGFAVVIR